MSRGDKFPSESESNVWDSPPTGSRFSALHNFKFKKNELAEFDERWRKKFREIFVILITERDNAAGKYLDGGLDEANVKWWKKVGDEVTDQINKITSTTKQIIDGDMIVTYEIKGYLALEHTFRTGTWRRE